MSSSGEVLVLVGLLFAILPGCGQGRRRPDGMRVVSLVPSITEIVFALDAGGMLAGTTNQCDYPEAARQTPKVGDFVAPDIEMIAALRPELVFVAIPMHSRLVEKLRELHIRTCVSGPESVPAILAEIDSVGRILGKKEKATELVDSLRAVLGSMPVWPDTPGVYVEISATPLMTVGGRTFITDIIRRAGGRNVFDNAAADYPVIGPEEVVARNPDVIIVLHPGTRPVEIAQRLGWDRIAAVKIGRVYDDLDDDLLMRPGPRAIEGICLLATRLHDNKR